MILLLISGIVDGKHMCASINHQVHIVQDLKAKVLVGIDILSPKQAIIDLSQRKLTLLLCENMTTDITITPKHPRTS